MKRVLKIGVLTVFLGITIGIAAYWFLQLLEWATWTREHEFNFHYLLPVVGLVTAVTYARFGKGAHRGNNLIIDSIHRDDYVPLRMAFMTFFFTILTHLSGGSAGREGTAVQMGGTFSYHLARIFQLNRYDRRVMLMAGISAGFGAVFGTPLAGAFFGMEMAFVGKLSYEALFPSFLAAYVADSIARTLGAGHSVYAIQRLPSMNPYILVIIVGSAILFGVIGRLFAQSVHRLKSFYGLMIKEPGTRAVIAASILLGCLIIFNAAQYDGLSTWMIQGGLRGETTLKDVVYKFVLTVLTLGAGFQGGEVTPLFDIGAAMGGWIGQVSGIEPSLIAALGMISVFGAAANTPITTIMLGIEIFGAPGIPYYIIIAIVSYFSSGHYGIYSSQVIETSKQFGSVHHKGVTLAHKHAVESDGEIPMVPEMEEDAQIVNR